MMWLIVPLSRPEMVENVIANVRRQRLPCELVLARNGRARDCWTMTSGLRVWWIDAPEDSVASAMNAGLGYARKLGSHRDVFCKIDDDDYYGPEYLLAVADGFSRGADVVARAACWYRTQSGAMWFIDGPQRQFVDHTAGLHGPTIAGRLDCADFENVGQWGEDHTWFKRMGKLRSKFWATRAGSFCWMRYGTRHGHSYAFGDHTIGWSQQHPVIDTGARWDAGLVELDRPEEGSAIKFDADSVVEEMEKSW